jgi:hypothetical protein
MSNIVHEGGRRGRRATIIAWDNKACVQSACNNVIRHRDFCALLRKFPCVGANCHSCSFIFEGADDIKGFSWNYLTHNVSVEGNIADGIHHHSNRPEVEYSVVLN